MPTSTGLAVMGAVLLLAFAKGAYNGDRLPLAILLALLAAGTVGWAIYDWIFFLNPS